MRIVFLISSLGSGGAERVATMLCNAWAARGDKVTLISTFSGKGRTFYEVAVGVELVTLADVVSSGQKNIRTYFQRTLMLRRLIGERNPDVIVSFLTNVNIAGIVSSAFLGIPLVICERTDPSVCPGSRIWTFLSRLLYRFSDVLVVQTDAVARKIEDVYPGLRRVVEIPNPVSDEVFAIRPRSGVCRKVLLSLGRLSQEKQTDRLIAGFQLAAKSFDEWELHIYGEGPLRSALEAQIQAAGLDARVFLMGVTSDPWGVMAGSDAFALTSRFEGFPNALLEAMGAGLPCLAFDCPSGPRELTSGGKYGLLVAPDDQDALISALTTLMGDEALRRRLGSEARKSVVKRFALRRVLDRWDQLFFDLGATGMTSLGLPERSVRFGPVDSGRPSSERGASSIS